MNDSNKKSYQAPMLLVLSSAETRSGTISSGENPGKGSGDEMMNFRNLVVDPNKNPLTS